MQTDPGSAPVSTSRRHWLFVTLFCVLGVTGLNFYRGVTQSITHDEAVTWDRYCRGPFYQLVSSTDANNHILHSLLCRASIGLFGSAEVSLRLPSMIAGGLFLMMIARIGWRVWGASPLTPVAVLLLGLNPLILDYLSAARGYSLALMLWAAALDRLLAASQTPWSDTDAWHRALRRASQLLALTVLANLTFALAVVSLTACFGAWAWCERRRMGESPVQIRKWFWVHLVRPGAIVFACLALPMVKLTPKSFYFGATSVRESLHSMVHASFAHHTSSWLWPSDSSAWFDLVLDRFAMIVLPLLVLSLLAIWVPVALAVLRRPGRPESGVMLYHLAASSLGLTVLMLATLHVLGMKLPIERTGLYLLTPLALAFLSAGSALATFRLRPEWFAPGLRRAALAVGILVCLSWGLQVQTDHYRPWKCESDSRTVFRTIMAQHAPDSKQRIRVGASWGLAPALNFYRERYRADYIEPIQRRSDFPPDVDVYVLSESYGGPKPTEPVKVIYRNEESGTTLATPTRDRQQH